MKSTKGWIVVRVMAVAIVSLPVYPADFQNDILPILKANCFPCHDERTHSSGLALTSVEALIAGGARQGPAMLPGQPEKSPVVKMLRGELQPRMPMGRAQLATRDIAVIEQWIKESAPALKTVDTKQSRYWAFVPPVKHNPPSVRNTEWVSNDIDKFVLAKLEAAGLKPAEQASRRVLVRRLYFDLLGLPPTPQQVESFVNDRSPKAYEDLVERLLADPAYGERWGGHWLDLARYADTNGYENDSEHPHAWRYRDYVVDAFNKDKPYDLFIREQIAGDEFHQVDSIIPAPPPEPEQAVALTFLRLAPFYRNPISEAARDSLLSEMTATTGSVFLGLTLGCAKCHNHKYDSVPTKDFYRMKAFFAAIQIAGGKGEGAAFYRPGEKEWTDAARTKYQKEVEAATKDFEAYQKPLIEKLSASRKTPAKGQDVAKAINTENNNMVTLDKSGEVFSSEEKQEYRRLLERIVRLKRVIERLEPLAMGIHNSEGPPNGPSTPASFVLIRGEWDQLGEMVEPGFLSAITGNSDPATLHTDRYKLYSTRGRRKPLADWISSPENPLTARVMVNRIWQQHFGRGIVETPSDFGRNGTSPTHPELLDWLATRFVEEKWSIKAIHRLILHSSAWRQSAEAIDPKTMQVDPANHLFSRFNRRRLEGEVVRDSILSVSGRLNPERGGLPIYPALPPGVDAKVKDSGTWETSTGDEARKRSIYIFRRRSQYVPFLETFDAPIPDASCDRRRTSVTALQALSLYDSEFVNDEATHFAARVRKESGTDPNEQVRLAFQISFGRTPSTKEQKQAREFLTSSEGDPLQSLCRVLINSNEFLYID